MRAITITTPGMRLKTLSLLLLLVLPCLARVASGGSLDAPGTKPITVKSEIDRGQEAVMDAATKYRDILDFRKAVENIEDTNTQRNTDTPGFLLGLVYQKWQSLWLGLSYNIYKGADLNLAVVEADIGYKSYHAILKKLDLTMDQMKACDSQYGGQAEDVVWERAYASKNFYHTDPHAGTHN